MELFFLYILSAFLLFVFLCLQILYYKHGSSSSSTKYHPGRTGWHVVGETLEFLSTGWRGHPKKFILDRMIKFSSECFRTSILMEPVAVLCGPSGNKFLFSNENKLFTAWWPDFVPPLPSAITLSHPTALMQPHSSPPPRPQQPPAHYHDPHHHTQPPHSSPTIAPQQPHSSPTQPQQPTTTTPAAPSSPPRPPPSPSAIPQPHNSPTQPQQPTTMTPNITLSHPTAPQQPYNGPTQPQQPTTMTPTITSEMFY